jgi:GNAT superfamily N-acetyltransferase
MANSLDKVNMWKDKEVQKRVFALCKLSESAELKRFPSLFGGWRTPIECYILRIDNEDAGFIIYTNGIRVNRLYEIMVSPKFQGQGCGRMMFNMFHTESRGKTMRWKTLKTGGASQFYLQLGYSPKSASEDATEWEYEVEP